jgi:NADPH:quinone reductase-like Zn-dependent oxidoreductase
VPSGAGADLVEVAKEMGKRATGFLVEPDPVGLAGLCRLVEAGRLRVKVDAAFDLGEAPAAHRLAEAGHDGGKIVLRVP